MSGIYPFVTEAYLTDRDGNRIDTVSGKQNVTLHVKFNRDMAQDIQPMVTYGGSDPYTDYSPSGDWVGPREWAASFTITPDYNFGRMYIRVKGAAAADDRWLVTGEDSARFFFEISKTGAQSMSLQAEPQVGQNLLNWMQNDYDTLAGFNVYRGTKYNSSAAPEGQGFKRINSSLITAEELSFIDTDVDPKNEYYYYFTVVKTDLSESKASNVVSATPLETESPVIAHTPVTTHKPETAISITAAITDNVSVQGATLYYKNKTAEEWKSATMRNTTGKIYAGAIPAYDVADEAIEYYITATDGTNIGTLGTKEEPMTIEAYYVKSVRIVAEPDKLEYDIGEALDLTGMIVTAVYNNGDVVKITDYTVSRFDNKTEGEKKLAVSYDGVSAELALTVTVKHNHKYVSSVTKEATCKEEGVTTYRCSVCGDEYAEPIEKLPHEYASEVTLAPACDAKGIRAFTCANCGEEYTEDIAPTGHSYKDKVTAPTCEEKGFTEHTCELCGDTYTDSYTAPKGHVHITTVVTQPTCISDGKRAYTCLTCGDSFTEVIKATGHDHITRTIKPTCEDKGYTLHTCAVCGDSYKDSYTEPKGHSYRETIVAPTQTELGYTYHFCTSCCESYKDHS